MAITRTSIIDDDGTGTTGTVIDNAWKQELYNQIDAVIGGAWLDVAFDVANFWPGVAASHVSMNRYTVINKTMHWTLRLANAPGPTPTGPYLYCTIPGGYTLFGTNAALGTVANAYDSGTAQTAFVTAGSASTVAILKNSGGNWTTAGPIYVDFTITLGLA